MSDVKFKGATINKNNPDKKETADGWDITFSIDVDPKECAFPDELAENISYTWKQNAGTYNEDAKARLCKATIEGNNVTFAVIRSEVQSLEPSVRRWELFLQITVKRYISKMKLEETSEEDLNRILSRISGSN